MVGFYLGGPRDQGMAAAIYKKGKGKDLEAVADLVLEKANIKFEYKSLVGKHNNPQQCTAVSKPATKSTKEPNDVLAARLDRLATQVSKLELGHAKKGHQSYATPRKQASATPRKQVITRSCFRCDRTNHVKRDCRANYHANGKPICRTCNIVGHRTFDCTRCHHGRHDGPRHDNGRHTTRRRQVSVTTRDRPLN